MGESWFERLFGQPRLPLHEPRNDHQDDPPVGPVDTKCEEIEREYQSSYYWRGPQRYFLEEKWLECRARREGWAQPKSAEDPKSRSTLSEFFSFDSGKGNPVGLGLIAFCPWLIPLVEAHSKLPIPDLADKLGISLDSVIEGLKAFNKQSAENRKKFENEIEGAIRNPTLGDLKKGDLFVLDEAGLNQVISELLNQGPQKVRNVKVKIDGDRLKISGEYDTWAGWIDFTAVAEFEQKNGESSGFIKKIEAVGIDLTDTVKTDLLNSFRNFGIEPPENADIKDLSWVQIPGIKRLEIRRDLVILEREPSPSGPS